MNKKTQFLNIPIDALTMQPHTGEGKFHQASYIMITGDPILSPDNNLELIACTNENNTNGEIIKEVIAENDGHPQILKKNKEVAHN